MRNRRNGGFTLVELIVVIGVLAVPATIGTIMMNKVMTLWRAESTRTAMDNRATYIFNQMEQDFGQAVSCKLSGDPIKGMAQTAQDTRFHRIQIEDDRFFIPATLVGGGGSLERADVGYYINRENGACKLMRTVRVPGAPKPAEQVVADGVLAMRVEFLGAQGWQTGWSGASHPQAARVSLTLLDTDTNMQQIARKAVFSIHVI